TSLRPSSGSAAVIDACVARGAVIGFPAMTPERKLNVSPSPELTMYSNTALVTPKSSEASADNARVPVGVRRTLSLAGDRSVTTGGAPGIELVATRRAKYLFVYR